MNELALFAGAGGGLLGSTLLGWRTVCAVEIEPYCRELLLRRQRDGVLDLFPIWDDARTFDGRPWCGIVDVLSAGFPCQPFSVAGKRSGKDDERNLWPETLRIIREVGPAYCLLENVPGLLVHEYCGTILGDLAESGYCAAWDCISAAACGANHRRERLWIVANAYGAAVTSLRNGGADSACRTAEERTPQGGPFEIERGGLSAWVVPDPHISGLEVEQGQCSDDVPEQPAVERSCVSGAWWQTEPSVGRMADGVAFVMDRLKALGNGQVPAVVERAWQMICPMVDGRRRA
jgi:DNA (cytosine-5)-methyltransferase 1